jgi:hypothetical protein
MIISPATPLTLTPVQGTRFKYTTHLPTNIAVIRAVAALAFTALVAFKLAATVFCWPVVLAGAAFAGWTIYKHVFSKDPMIEAFYSIVGGKDKFEQLPEVQLGLSLSNKVSTVVSNLDWDDINADICKTKTLDGRHVIIAKSRTHPSFPGNVVKTLWVYVEKLGPQDLPRRFFNVSELADSALHAIMEPRKGNEFERNLGGVSVTRNGVTTTNTTKILSSVTLVEITTDGRTIRVPEYNLTRFVRPVVTEETAQT